MQVWPIDDVSTYKFCCALRYVNDPDAETGITPLMMAVDAEDGECIKKILAAAAANGIRVDAKDADGCTVFHHVARIKNERISRVKKPL